MTTETLRKKIISKVQTLEDEDLLKTISRLIELGEDDDVYMLSEEQLSKVDAADKELQEGKLVYGKDFKKEVKEWLKDK